MKLQQHQKQKTSFNLVYAGAGFATLFVVGALIFFFNVGNVRDTLASGKGSEALWEGKYSSDWNDSRNWKGGKLPSSGAKVSISKYRKAPVVSKGSKFSVKELELKDGSKMTISARLEVTNLLKLSKKSDLVVSGQFQIKKDVKIEGKSVLTLSKGSSMTVGGKVEIKDGSLILEDGALGISGDLELEDDDSYFIQKKGKSKVGKDIHLICSKEKGEATLSIEGGKFVVSGETRFYKSNSKNKMVVGVEVSGGEVNFGEVSRTGGKSGADYNFKISGGEVHFWEDLIMDDSGTSGRNGKKTYCSGVSDWSKSTIYERSDANEIVAVSYEGYEYRLKQNYWWSKGDKPDSKGKGYWLKQGKCGSEDKSYDCKKAKKWNKNATYKRKNGDSEYYVLHNGDIYRLNKTCWHTKGNEPGKAAWAWVKWAECSSSSGSYDDKLVHSGGEIVFHKKSVRPKNFQSTNSGIVYFKDKQNPITLKAGEKYVNIVIDTSASVTLTGDIEFTGDLTNNSTQKPSGSFKFKMNGTGDQTINGKEPIEFETLEIDKSKGGVFIRQDITITNKMTFTTETVVVIGEKSGSNKKAQEAMVTFADGATYEGDGWFEGAVAKIGSEAFVFPTGKSGRKGYISMTAPASTSTYTAEYFVSEAPDASDLGAGLLRVSSLEYWILEQEPGASAVDVTLHWDDGSFSQISDPGQLMVAEYDGDQWQTLGNSGTTGNSSSGTITGSSNASNYQYFTFGSNSSSGNALPVEFIKFTAQRMGSEVVLDWATATEENNDLFEVQRSEDGVNYEVLGEVKGAGTTINGQTYSFTDVSAPNIQLYYRLKQIDFNGVFDYSRVANISGEEGGQSAIKINSIYPNPFVQSFQVNFDAPGAGRAQISLINSGGQVIYQNELDVWSGTNSFNYNEGAYLTTGYYILTLKFNDQLITEKIYKKN